LNSSSESLNQRLSRKKGFNWVFSRRLLWCIAPVIVLSGQWPVYPTVLSLSEMLQQLLY
jgi:hypothetical protein